MATVFNQIPGSDKRRPCDWLPERVRLRYVAGSGLLAMSSTKNSFLESFIPYNTYFIDQAFSDEIDGRVLISSFSECL